MNGDELEKAHIKGQLQGLRAALRQQPGSARQLVQKPQPPKVLNPTPPPATPVPPPASAPLPPPTPMMHPNEDRTRQLELQLREMQLQMQLRDAQEAAKEEEARRREKLEAAHRQQQQQLQQPPPQNNPPLPPPPVDVVVNKPRARAASPRPAARRESAAVRPAARDVTPPPPRPQASAPSAAPSAAANGKEGPGTPVPAKKKAGNKSDCVARVEEMQKQREERRRKAAEKKNQREEQIAAAEGMGLGIESVDFLNQIKAYREAHNLPDHPSAFNVADVWRRDDGSCIRVCVRKRPMLKVEQLRMDFDVVCAEETHNSLVVLEPKQKVDLTKQIEAHKFQFDAVFNESDGNDRIYGATLSPLLAHVFAGGHATVFAFGQTGSGKTCTMAGHGNENNADGNAVGLYKLAAHDTIAWARHQKVSLGVSFFEVYRGQVLDLLGDRARLEVLEDGRGRVQLPGMREVQIESADELLDLVRQAEELRAVGATSANEQSSRSHAILQVVLRDSQGRGVGKLSLVDLAGSERAADASSKDRQTRIEGAEINKSLLCLKECIRSLDSGSSHTPFRGSKLTQVLRDSFIGKAKTVMIANVSPGSSAAEYTLNTLRYAQRVKEFSKKAGGGPGGAAGGNGGGNPASAANRRVSGAVRPGGGGPPAGGFGAAPPNNGPMVGAFAGPPRGPMQPPAEDLGGTRRFSEEPQGAFGEDDRFANDIAAADVAEPPVLEKLNSGRVAAAEEAAIEELSATLKQAPNGANQANNGADVGEFFKTVAAVSRAEEVLIAQHKEAVEADELLLAQEKMMLDDLKEADGCSVDEYASALEKVLGAKLRICAELQQRLDALKETMANEEALSARVRQVPLY